MTRRQTPSFTLLAATAATLCFCAVSMAQERKPAPANPPAPPAATRNYEPGMLASMGRWFKDSFNLLGSGVDSASTATKNAAKGAVDAASGAASATANATADAAKGTVDAAKDAAGAMARISGTNVVKAHERCSIAENGAPDCHRAAETVCKAKGFASGSSLNIESERKCPARVWLERRADSHECRTQSYVTSAMCR